jgi:2,3-bisphosphoglycerate-independent phosphoglycerate mutase
MNAKRAILVILDGWGHGPDPKRSAIAQASTPFVDSLYDKYPNSELVTFGEEVGLPEGQMGNSEVGHMNIGAGRIVYQDLARINKAIRERELHQNKTLLKALEYAKSNERSVHIMGLVSDGGVHSHLNHLLALCDITQEQEIKDVFIHAFTDGRDTDPKGGAGYLKEVLDHIEGQSAQLASVIGRYYAMDRDKRWERTKLAYDLLVRGKGEATTDALATIRQRYDQDETDEFLKPIVVTGENGEPIATLQDGDVLICFNFRNDRPRQISEVLTQRNMPDYDMKKLDLYYVTMTRYEREFKDVHILFHKQDIKNTIGEVLSKAGKTQVRIAETEKYAHVTYFLNGGREIEYEGEKRILIPSPKVATYDLKPEMSAYEVTDAIVNEIEMKLPDFICLNYANADMVGHTGVFEAAVKAAEAVDKCLKRLIGTALAHDYEAIVIADHGNADYMINDDGTPNTAHTKNMVPCFYISNDPNGARIKNGKLGDIAPTILTLLGIDIPKEMTGDVLITKKAVSA